MSAACINAESRDSRSGPAKLFSPVIEIHWKAISLNPVSPLHLASCDFYRTVFKFETKPSVGNSGLPAIIHKGGRGGGG